MKKPSTSLSDSWVMFRGYDGVEYHAYVQDVRKGVARITYRVPGHVAPIMAYIDDATRLYVPVTAITNR